ncbi:aspartate ammonia-lyase [Bradyrhizobium yuanmingense]|uniref:aspartate ammonia-lyase n=1 Tax=Bradyrhizobium yuanmingense TaxID=108015 RepID=UPI0023B90FCF|nr:aspartate ammonia-lyase [Bradyrhizobium yuanmingense]MDF0498658.1 aspartate ammonia-lyase [Bradyrhizobium yuanmingense]
MGKKRREADSLGGVEIPSDAYYGAQTMRAIDNFPISGVPIGHLSQLIYALAIVKKAAVLANARLGDIAAHKANAIAAACDDIIAGDLITEFPIDVFQGGAGTSTNMNVNEVVANRALEHLGFPRGRYDIVHPNDDVNLSQSTNDVYPTAIRLAILLAHRSLDRELRQLGAELERKGAEFAGVIKLGRTQLQDAVPMTLGQEFTAFAITVREDVPRLDELVGLFREVNLGGTAIGTEINTKPDYAGIVVEELSRLTEVPFVAASNLIEACWDTGSFVLFSGMLKRTATKLSKISNDLRLLSSGPRGGLCEINLPAVQPGSSIMPGKVNPVIPEVVNQVAFQVIGADLTITLAAEAGQLQLNVMEPVIAYSMLQSISLLTNAARLLREKCIVGITANMERCRQHLEASTAVVTALTPLIRYERASDVAKSALKSGRNVWDVLKSELQLAPELLDQLRDPSALTRPWKAQGLEGSKSSAEVQCAK